MRRILLLSLLMVFSVLVFAQTKTVTGSVVDETGAAVPFASITIKGTNNGVSADANGKFNINTRTGTVLVVTATGYGTQEITVGAGNTLSIILKKGEGQIIDEVVVTGVSGIKRIAKGVSYNAQVVNQEQLNPIRQTNLNNALAGKVSGIQVRSQSAAALGRETEVRLRGESGVIYIVDGTILPSAEGVNIDDIEDVTVLQGPAATAQYGSQGGNGAIVITLKKGKKSPGIGLTVNSGATFERVYVLPNYQNSYAGGNSTELIKYIWNPTHPVEWKALDGKYYHDYSDDASWGPRMVGQEYIPWYSWYGGHSRSYKTAILTPQPNNAKNFFNTGLVLNNNISFSKASDDMDLRVSYGNINVKGIIPTSSLNKHTFNLKTNVDLSSKFIAGVNLNYISSLIKGQVEDDGYSNQSTGSFNQWFHRDLDMGIMRELQGLRTPDGIYASWNKANPNSYDPAHKRDFYAANYWYNFFTWFNLVDQRTAYDRWYGDINLTYKITSDLKLKGTYRKQQNTAWSEQKFRSELNESGLQTTGNSPEAKGYYATANSYSNRQNIEFLLSYTKKIGQFNVNMNAGTDFFRWDTKSNGGSTNDGLSVPNLFTLQNSKNAASIFNGRIQEKYNAAYVLGAFDYKNFLFFDFSVRNDWYSTLPKNNNSVLSKSIGGSFVFTDVVKIPTISYGKIRASWGEIPQALGLSSTTFGAYRYPGFLYGVGADQWNGNILMGTPNELVDPNIHGAVKTQKEIGLDLRFLKNRIGLSVTYWDGTNTDIPTSVTMNGATGFNSLLTNTGKQTKKGIDVQLLLKPVSTENFKWDINATWGYLLRYTVDSIASGIDRTGQIEGIWGTRMPYRVNAKGMQWGQIFGNGIKRINGQPVINDDGTYVNDPAVYFGSVLPRYTGGIQNSMVILKNFIVNANIDYQAGGKFVSLSDMWGSYSGLTAKTATINDKGNSIRDAVSDGGGVHVYGVDKDGKAKDVYMEAQDYFHGLYNSSAFDPFIYDLTFVKLREVSLGYKIPVQKIGAGKWIQSAMFSVVARNPLIIYATTKDFDPSEISAATGETGQFPGTRGLGFNLKIGF